MGTIYRGRYVLASLLFIVLAAGFAAPGANGVITGICWDDLNGDGVRDAGEYGIDGMTVQLLDASDHSVLATCVTESVDLNDDGEIDPDSEQGVYKFAGREAGEYLVAQVSSPDWRETSYPERDFILERSAPVGVKDYALKIIERDPATGKDINSFAPPSEYPPGEIAYGPGKLFYVQATSTTDLTPCLWQLDPDTGEVIDQHVVPIDSSAQWVKYGLAYLSGKVYILSPTGGTTGGSTLIEWDPLTAAVTATVAGPAMAQCASLSGAADRGVLLAVTSDLQGFQPATEVMEIDPATGALLDTVPIEHDAYAVGYYDGHLLVAGYDLYPEHNYPQTWVLDADTGRSLGAISAEPATLQCCDKWAFAGDGVKGIAPVSLAAEAAHVDFGIQYRLAGDCNRDSFVGQGDLDVILDNWGRNVGYGNAADFSEDGFVGQADLDVILDNWGSRHVPVISQLPPPAEALAGDVNGDGFVGQDDLDAIIDAWGRQAPAGDPADLDGDGLVGQGDLDVVLDNWGASLD